MSASWPGNMRGPRMKTPLLLLLVLAALTGTVLCQDEPSETEAPELITGEEPETEQEAETETELEPYSVIPVGDNDPETSADTSPSSVDPEGHGSGTQPPDSDPSYSDHETEEESQVNDGLNPIIIMIPVGLVIVIIAMIVCGIFISRRWTKKVGNQRMLSDLSKEDPYLDGSSTEKVPMPMFEEDVPSVMELEMEELDQWMKKDTETAEDSKDV